MDQYLGQLTPVTGGDLRDVVTVARISALRGTIKELAKRGGGGDGSRGRREANPTVVTSPLSSTGDGSRGRCEANRAGQGGWFIVTHDANNGWLYVRPGYVCCGCAEGDHGVLGVEVGVGSVRRGGVGDTAVVGEDADDAIGVGGGVGDTADVGGDSVATVVEGRAVGDPAVVAIAVVVTKIALDHVLVTGPNTLPDTVGHAAIPHGAAIGHKDSVVIADGIEVCHHGQVLDDNLVAAVWG